ncbi:metal ABC transporter permease [Pseudomonas syringae]|nr:metal ABC transporter permease [Pseudomonas syringae]MBD8577111.1 metal ABC transporter permease [Pseudomonas syringae]MBD8792816.1 metal ABC transporter permease [Pseudomonas syringae]MBD8803319.1 metal ABC transporter permease [Pseudomonas syringae]MBD8811916.1 metal ABC transporter permease [Pseudomonas syringae]
MSLPDLLLSPFQFDFMINALIVAMLVSLPMALLSCFLVLRGWALMGDAVSHAVFPGVVIAYIINIPYAIGAFVAGMGCAIASGFLKDNSRIKQDTVMGVVYSGMFGLGLVLYVKIESSVHLDHILFGDILGVGPQDILGSAAIAALTLLVIGLKWKDLLLHAFDPAHAQAVGLRVRLLHYGLLSLISLTIVGALKAAGIILAISLLIAPGAIALLLTRTFKAMLLMAMVIAVAAAFLGVYLAFFIDSAPAPTIVLLYTIVFIGAFIRTTVQQARSARAT